MAESEIIKALNAVVESQRKSLAEQVAITAQIKELCDAIRAIITPKPLEGTD